MPNPPATEQGYVIAFDFGLKNIGTAVGQTVTGTASPLSTLRAKNGVPRWPDVAQLLEQLRPVRLLVGLPLNMDDTDNPITTAARAFARKLEKQFDVPVSLVDERLSTVEAMEKTGGNVQHSHNVAAALIAETYLKANS